ncbi:MAG TPA: hypothetical protein VE953_16455 [Terriglobales bacterium]|nr:hypothetical protein [Terriglobales bacterium]
MASRYAQALEQQRRFARWLATPDGVRAFFDRSPDQVSMRSFYQGERLTLAAADPYHWLPEMCDLLEQVSAEMPPWTLRREALPTDFGFCWFEAPLPSTVGFPHVVALTWGVHRARAGPPARPDTLLIGVYGGDPRDWQRIRPLLNLTWEQGTRITMEDLDPDAAGERPPGRVPVFESAEQRRAAWRFFLYVAAIFALLEQRILVARPEGIDRAALRRLKKAKARTPPAILVVRLRRAVHEGDDADGHPRAWTCRWIVRGHWRQQFYPSSGEYRPIFILPYIKGPDDMPLRAPAERVFAVVR